MAGKISSLCAIGAEKVCCSSIFSLRPRATEPILPDVSSANISIFWFIRAFSLSFFSFLLPMLKIDLYIAFFLAFFLLNLKCCFPITVYKYKILSGNCL